MLLFLFCFCFLFFCLNGLYFSRYRSLMSRETGWWRSPKEEPAGTRSLQARCAIFMPLVTCVPFLCHSVSSTKASKVDCAIKMRRVVRNHKQWNLLVYFQFRITVITIKMRTVLIAHLHWTTKPFHATVRNWCCWFSNTDRSGSRFDVNAHHHSGLRYPLPPQVRWLPSVYRRWNISVPCRVLHY